MKLAAYTIMITVMILFLSFMGLDIPGLNPVTDALGINITNGTTSSVDMESSTIWDSLVGSQSETVTFFGQSFTKGILLGVISASLIGVGLYVLTKDIITIIAPFILIIGGLFISTSATIINYVASYDASWMTNIVTIIFVAVGLGFVWAIVDYITNR